MQQQLSELVLKVIKNELKRQQASHKGGWPKGRKRGLQKKSEIGFRKSQ